MFLGPENILHPKLGRPPCHLEGAEIQLASLLEGHTKASPRSPGKWSPPETDGELTAKQTGRLLQISGNISPHLTYMISACCKICFNKITMNFNWPTECSGWLRRQVGTCGGSLEILELKSQSNRRQDLPNFLDVSSWTRLC